MDPILTIDVGSINKDEIRLELYETALYIRHDRKLLITCYLGSKYDMDQLTARHIGTNIYIYAPLGARIQPRIIPLN